MPMEKAVILCSGGVKQRGSDFGRFAGLCRQAPARPLWTSCSDQGDRALFEKLADFFNVQDRLAVDMPHFAAIGGNARVSRKRQIEDALALGEGNLQLLRARTDRRPPQRRF